MKHYDNDMKIFSCMLYLQMLICGSFDKKLTILRMIFAFLLMREHSNKYIC